MSMSLSDGDAPSVSIVIPAYNAQSYIGSAIRSAQAQTMSNLEIIVVDDASTDGTAAIVQEFSGADRRVRYARMEKNSGPAASRNCGLRLARGEWIALLDADDRFHPNRLEALLTLARTSGAEIVADNLLFCTGADDAGRPMIPEATLAAPRPLMFAEFMESCHQGWNKPKRISYVFMHPMFKREFIEANSIRYNERCRNGEDFLFYVDLFLARGTWYLTPEPMYVYLVNAGSLTDIVSREDRRQMVAKLRTTLRDPIATSDARLFSAIRTYWKFVASDLYYWSFKDAVRAADHRDALRILSLDRAALQLILNEVLKRGAKAGWRRIKGQRTAQSP